MNFSCLDVWRESSRIVLRAVWRTQAFFSQNKLRAAERHLGELGWQQANYDPDDVAATKLQLSEKEQARLVFEAAESKEELADFQAITRGKSAVMEDQISKAAKQTSHLQLRIAQLRKLLASEKARGSPDYVIDNESRTIEAEELEFTAASRTLKEMRQTLAGMEKEARAEVDSRLAALKILEARLQDVQGSQPTHFAKIGHDLADVGIAPINQPQALDEVLGLRCNVAAGRQKIRQSLFSSRQQSRACRLLAWLLLLLAPTAAAILLWLLL